MFQSVRNAMNNHLQTWDLHFIKVPLTYSYYKNYFLHKYAALLYYYITIGALSISYCFLTVYNSVNHIISYAIH